MNRQVQNDLTRTVLLVLFIGVLIVGSLWTMLPFLGAMIWATTITVATWPMMLQVQRLVGGNRTIATVIMTVLALAIFIVPFWFAIGGLVDATAQGAELVKTYVTKGLGPPPEWLGTVPWIGAKIAERWRELGAGGPEMLVAAVRPHVDTIAAFLLSITGGFGMVIVHFILTVIIAAIFYAKGEVAAGGVLKFARRVGHERGEQIVHLAGQAIRGVALGVIVTAIVQSLMAGIGLWIAGVPRAGLLVAVIFVLGVAQLGPLPVLLPAVIWLYWSGSIGWAAALFVWMIIVGALDNILRPILIRRGVDLPLLLIVAGVIGGLIAFGVIGLFIGPVILAVTYTLLQSWINESGRSAT